MLIQVLFGDEFIIMVEQLSSRNLDFKFQLVCPTYALWQLLHVILYIPLFSCSCNRVGATGFMRWCNVVVVLSTMSIFVFLNKLVIFLIFGLWKANVVHGLHLPSYLSEKFTYKCYYYLLYIKKKQLFALKYT